MTIESVIDFHAELGECPVWAGPDRGLFWIDIDGRAVHRYHPWTGTNETRRLDVRPGSFALTADPDRLLVAAEHQLLDMTWSTGEVSVRSDLEPDGEDGRMNDGRCDPAGRFWVGSMDLPSSSGRRGGMLHRVEPDGSTEVVFSGIVVANGLAFSPDGTVMYRADTGRELVWAYDYDVDTGTPANERVFLDFADLPGKPDGACVDETGCYWIACVYGWTLLRVTPAGEIDRRIELPIERPTMPAFGGPDLDLIYVTSLSRSGSVPMAPNQPEAGGLFVVDPGGVKGLPEPVFGG